MATTLQSLLQIRAAAMFQKPPRSIIQEAHPAESIVSLEGLCKPSSIAAGLLKIRIVLV
jgi:hypothetical protein